MQSWRALDAIRDRESSVLSVKEHDLVTTCRLMPASAAYDPTRVAVGASAVHTGIRHNRTIRSRTGADRQVESRISRRRLPVRMREPSRSSTRTRSTGVAQWRSV